MAIVVAGMAFAGVACGSGNQATATPDELISEVQAIKVATQHVSGSEPELRTLEEPRNPEARRMTWHQYEQISGEGGGSKDGDLQVWVVQLDGLWESALAPIEVRTQYAHAVVVINALDGSVIASNRSNVLEWP